MRRYGWNFLIAILMTTFGLGGTPAAWADVCAICGKPITGTVYIATDKVTGERKIICSDCAKLPECYICGMPVKEGGVELADGRYLCARDSKTVVLNADEAGRICNQVEDELNHLFSRYTSFPTNVDVTVIDRIDVDSMFHPPGNDFESPNLLGCIQPMTVDGETRYKMRVMTGLPLAELKETCAHEYSHAWVGENVNRARRGLGRDAEEGFCELVGYLLMDSQQEESEKKRVLQNRYTRGQIDLFIEAEQRYGFDQVLDWMKYGTTPQLEAGHLQDLRDLNVPAAELAASHPVNHPAHLNSTPAIPVPAAITLQGILWGSAPTAIINGHSFEVNDVSKVKFGETNVTLRCVAIQPSSVFVQNVSSGQEQELHLPGH
jgi:Protein DA1